VADAGRLEHLEQRRQQKPEMTEERSRVYWRLGGFLAADLLLEGRTTVDGPKTRVKPSTKIATTKNDQEAFDRTANRPSRRLVGRLEILIACPPNRPLPDDQPD
jgi:hypothetical protein